MKMIITCLLVCSGVLTAEKATSPLSVNAKFRYHAGQTAGLGAFAGIAAYAGLMHAIDSPTEWPGNAAGYGRRLASAAGSGAIRNAIAFSLDSALKQDPRYQRLGGRDFTARAGHAASSIVVTRMDRGGRSVAAWRLGSTYSAAWLSNYWFPKRFHTASSAIQQGSFTLGGDLLSNLASEFWPDIKRKLFRRRRW